MGEGVVIEKYGAGSPRYSCNFVLKVTKIFLKIWSASRYVVRDCFFTLNIAVTSRKGRVSRNAVCRTDHLHPGSRPARGV